ncbi:ribonuclease H-like domain-containing protein, partial [Tanacetum coccineum]
NTIDHLGKFDGKADEGFFVGYSLNSKAFRVFNSRTRIVEENLHIRFSESTPNVVGSRPDWLFDIDALTRTMNYEPIVAGTQSNGFAGTKASDNAGQARKETEPVKDYILLPLWTADPPYSQDPKSSHDDGSKPSSDDGKKVNAVDGKTSIKLTFDPNMPALEDYNTFDFSRDDEDDGTTADMNNLDTTIQVSPNLTTRIHKDHPLDQEEPKKVAFDLLRDALSAIFGLSELKNGIGVNAGDSKLMLLGITYYCWVKVNAIEGGGPRCQETMGDTIAQTRFENVSKHSNDSLLIRGNTLRSDEDRLKLDELMALCTTLQNRVLGLEKTKTTQHNEISSLKRRVKKLEKKNRSRTHKLKRLYKVGLTARVESSDNEEILGEDASKQGRIDVINADEEITLVSVQNVDEEMFDVNVLDVSTAGDATTVSAATTTTATITTVDDITLAQALMEIKSTKPKEKGVVIQELKKYQIRLDEEVALKLKAEFNEEERFAREKAEKEKEANIALIETWDDIHAKINADHQLAERLQAQEQEELSVEEKATLFQQLLEKTRKHFAAKRNMEGYKLQDLKLKGFDSIQEMFNRAFKRVNTFEDFKTELVEGKEKRVGIELIQENAKKKKVQDLEDLYKLVKAKYESKRPVEDLDLLLWGDLKTMFEPHVEDNIYMLVEKKYPLAPLTLLMMLEKKLIIDYESEMAYQLLKFIIKKLKNTAQGQDCSEINGLAEVNAASTKLLLLVQTNDFSAEVNAASQNMLEVTTASEYQVNVAISTAYMICISSL